MPFLERCKKRFSHRIVIAVPGTTHSLYHPMSFQDCANSMIDVLLPSIRMQNQSWCYRSSSQSHLQCFDNSLCTQMISDRVADNPSREHILNRRQEQPSFFGVDKSYVAEPY